MKRGSTHADWAVSLGIFLVYTLSLFLLIQPGVEPVFRNENLIKIVEESFISDTRLVIEKTPIIFTPTEIETDNTYIAEISGNIPMVGEDFDVSDFSIRDINYEPLPFDMAFSPGNDPGSTIISMIRVQADFTTNEQTTLYLFYSPDAYGPLPIAASGIITISDGRIIDGERRLNFTRIFGSTEVMSGIDNEIILDPWEFCADTDTYSNLKTNWNYPINKDFQIFMILGSEPRYESTDITAVCNQTQPYEQANVFVQERVDNTLDRDGNKEPLRISMRVW